MRFFERRRLEISRGWTQVVCRIALTSHQQNKIFESASRPKMSMQEPSQRYDVHFY